MIKNTGLNSLARLQVKVTCESYCAYQEDVLLWSAVNVSTKPEQSSEVCVKTSNPVTHTHTRCHFVYLIQLKDMHTQWRAINQSCLIV